MDVCLASFRAPGSLFDDEPQVVQADMNTTGMVLTLTFDKALDITSPVVASRFFSDNAVNRWDGISVSSIVSNVMVLNMSTPIGSTGPTGSSYTAGTPVLFGTNGLPVSFFSGFITTFT